MTRQSKKTRKSSEFVGNEKIIKVLEMVKSHYAREHNTIHVNAYNRAIYQISKWPHPIKSGTDIAHLEGIGKGMVAKIDTILATGTLPIILEKGISESRKSNKSGSIGNPIGRVLGFSEKSAVELEKQYGIRTLEELKELVMRGEIKLTKMQLFGLRYYEDLRKKVPRVEITQIGNRIEDILSREKEGVMVFLAGSYPSGLKKESKDIDILLVVRDSSKLKNKSYLEELINTIMRNMPLETITLGANKFLGLVKLPGTQSYWRHLDMRLVDFAAFPYAWLHYTSGVIFNKIIREKLKKRGYKLNEWGLFKDASRISLEVESLPALSNLEKSNKQNLLDYTEKIEKEIFKLAQLEYKTVRERY